MMTISSDAGTAEHNNAVVVFVLVRCMMDHAAVASMHAGKLATGDLQGRRDHEKGRAHLPAAITAHALALGSNEPCMVT